ncbi:nucleotidyltransferase domain-containing protein [Curtobacterium sp. MCLR17_036]|uniref:nucleotidyltransferase domain-containing protein n=1 Tax=Curtobacterium sp. MCLR17_036 TaxID=2175620 RepID=UPI000DAA3787|nr:nucleotidyltransferase domain-containing protein [Curtobacterium sp. MCLR17_036]WIE65646.1 nucleotidyltransferase domain-containing protein [Curtobacterium sp. MCLR17_036]
MQLQTPFATVTTSVDGDVLAVLARAPGPMTIADICSLVPDRSYAGVRNSADRLVEQGVVDGHRTGRTKSFSLNREHLAADAVVAIANLRTAFLDRLRDGCEPIPLRYAAVFGSAARGEMRPQSDVDLCFVVLRGRRSEAETGIHALTERAARWSGNEVRPVVFDEDDVSAADALLGSVAREGIPLAGDGRWLVRRLRTLAG